MPQRRVNLRHQQVEESPSFRDRLQTTNRVGENWGLPDPRRAFDQPEIEGMDPERLRRRGLNEDAIQNLLQDEPTEAQYGTPLPMGFGNVAPQRLGVSGRENLFGRLNTRAATADQAGGDVLTNALTAPGRWANRNITEPTVEAARDVGRGVQGAQQSGVVNEQIQRAVSNLATDSVTKLAGLFSRRSR